ncbi:MAG: YlbE-like family protein [Bacilli bacterium]|nr:YlbE-like family protein [Bacilli bacterium]OLA10931.1 MAG: hypothetical protein BHW12_00680 [Coprobacillus sp. 28_7]CCY07464.1 putative uncharacterized protein [Coprobacillus sp. CAG:698]
MDQEILKKIYNTKEYLEYLRYHPKWYYYLDENPLNFRSFENVVKKEYKITSYDKLEKMKSKINFFTSMINYLNK